MKKAWRIRPYDQAVIQAYARQLGVSTVVAQLLLARGLGQADRAKAFLESKLSALRDPESLGQTAEAARRIQAAVKEGRKITIYGDYDVDGIAGTSILFKCLKLLGGNVNYYVPHRIEEGYGLNTDALRKLAEQGTQLVITVDCGITAVAPARVAKEIGLELIITDHHQFDGELPAAAAIVHPNVPIGHYPFTGLCGAGVAFKLAWAICKAASGSEKVGDRMREFLLQAIAYAAMGTIADVVPLIDENRILVKHGLVALRERPTIGLAHLMRVSKIEAGKELAAEDIAFALAPRLNAAGRLSQAALGVELLVTDSESRAESLADYVNELNANRQTLERSIYLAANKAIQEQKLSDDEPALVVSGRGWHPGVIGIVAGRLAEKFHCPVVMIALDEHGQRPGVGSARSIAGVDLHAALSGCREHLLACGGHAMAAGLSIEEARLDAFRSDFCERVASEFVAKASTAEILIDGEAPFSAFSLRVLDEVERLAPFGYGNPRPVWCTTGVQLAEPPKTMGGGERHLSLKLLQHATRMRAVSFGNAEWAAPIQAAQSLLDIVFRPVRNSFRGFDSVELHLVDWRPTLQAATA